MLNLRVSKVCCELSEKILVLEYVMATLQVTRPAADYLLCDSHLDRQSIMTQLYWKTNHVQSTVPFWMNENKVLLITADYSNRDGFMWMDKSDF